MWFAPGIADPKINPAIQLSDCQRHPLPPTAIFMQQREVVAPEPAGTQRYAAAVPYTPDDHVRSGLNKTSEAANGLAVSWALNRLGVQPSFAAIDSIKDTS
jgi:hypothetical protein